MAIFAMRMIFGRRAALRLIVAGCGALPFVAFPALAAAPATPALQRLAAIIPPAAAARLAARLRDVNGGMGGVEREFRDELGWLHREAEACPARQRLAAEIRRRVRDDFAADRVLRFDGWILSRTELALCHAVSQPGHALS
jgi:hypothetical protein